MRPGRAQGRAGPLGAVLAALLVAVGAACGDDGVSYEWETVEGVEYAASLGIDLSTFAQTLDTPSVWYKELTVGTGDSALVGDDMFTHVTGWLADGTQFQPTIEFSFTFFAAGTIVGMHLGTRGLLEGGTRKIIIPPEWAYGGQPPFAGRVLVFDVQLDSIQHHTTP